jgi:hypothetical protein
VSDGLDGIERDSVKVIVRQDNVVVLATGVDRLRTLGRRNLLPSEALILVTPWPRFILDRSPGNGIDIS